MIAHVKMVDPTRPVGFASHPLNSRPAKAVEVASCQALAILPRLG